MSTDATAPSPLRNRRLVVAIALVVALSAVYLRWQGRIWWCECGSPNPLSLRIDSHNSQHLIDAYSLSHVLHGVIFFGVLWPLRKKLSLGWRAAIAAGIEIGWEVLENSPIIINRYRTTTMSLGYTGDSLGNSLGDFLSFMLGFFLARKLGLWWSAGIIVLTELLMLWWIRDNLALNVLMLLWPIEAIKQWQSGG